MPLPPVTATPKGAQAPDAGSPEIDPAGHGIEMIQEGNNGEVFVLLHGITNTPQQFRPFGELLFRRGASVLIPRMPFHGYTNRMTPAPADLTAQMMLDEANRTIDRAKTLGRKVTVMGLSVNGVTAAWIAQNRADVDRVILLSPFFGPNGVPSAFIAPLSRLFVRLPNFFVWWDPQKKEAIGAGTLTYPRFATRPLADVMALGGQVFSEAKKAPMQAPRALLVTSAADKAINLPRTRELVNLWNARTPGRVESYEFPMEDGVPHDFMDITQPDQRVDLVYPALLKLLDGENPGDS